MAILDELLVELGFDYDPEALEQFQSDLDDTLASVKKLVVGLVAGTSALVGFAVATTRASDEQGKLADETGVAVEQLDALQFANRRAGGTADGLSSSLQQLAVRVGETARGVGSGIEAFGLLGISVNNTNGSLKSTDQILLEVAGRFDNFSKSQQIELADKLGLRDSIRLLQQGSGGIADLIKEAKLLGVTTAEDAALSAEFQDSLTDIWQIVKQLSRTLTKSLVPVMEDISNTFTEWWKANRKLIEQNIPKFIERAAFALKLLTLAAIGFISVKLIGTLASLITLMKGLTVSTLLANAAVLILPALIAAGIAAIALLAEDAKVFFEGGESFIGDMIEKFPQWADELRTVAAVFATLAKLVGMIFKGWSQIFDLFSSGTLGSDLTLVFKQLQSDFNDFISGILDGIDETITELKNKISNIFTGVKENISDALSIDNIKGNFLDLFGGSKDSDLISTITNSQFSQTDSPLTNSQFSQTDISNASNADNSTNINGGIVFRIDGSQSPENTANAIRKELADLAEQTSIDMNSAVRI